MMHQMMNGMMGGNWSNMVWNLWILPTIIGILFIGAIVYIIYWLFAKNKGITSVKRESPIEILKIRYAKGEITKKQFDLMKKELE